MYDKRLTKSERKAVVSARKSNREFDNMETNKKLHEVKRLGKSRKI